MQAELPTAPVRVLIDPSNRCNLRCRMCHFSFDHIYTQKPAFMPPEVFEKILGSIHTNIKTLTLSAASEPLTSPHFLDILAIASGFRPPHLNFLTNGALLTRRHADAIVEYGVTEVMVSVDGATKKTYEYIRRGADFDQLLRNIEYLIKRREATGKAFPIIQFNVTLMKSNIRELKDLVEMAATLGVSRMAFRHLIMLDGLGMEEESLTRFKETANEELSKALYRAAGLGVAITACPDLFTGDTGMNPSSLMPSFLRGLRDKAIPRIGRIWPGLLPIGCIDAPMDNCLCHADHLEISGWALGRSAVRRVEIRRDPVPADTETGEDGLVFVGDARFVNGTRPDVAALYPRYPLNYRAGWNFTLFRHMLPAGHPAKFRVHMIAHSDNAGRTYLGNRMLEFTGGQAPRPYLYCRRPFDCLYVDARSQVFPYPDCQPTYPFGSFADSSFEEIWRDDSFARLRQRIIDRDPPEICGRCPEFIGRNVDDEGFFRPKRIEGRMPIGFIDAPDDLFLFEDDSVEIRGRIMGKTRIEEVEIKRSGSEADQPGLISHDGLAHVGYALLSEEAAGDETPLMRWSFLLRRNVLPDYHGDEFMIYVLCRDNKGNNLHLGMRNIRLGHHRLPGE